VSVLVIGAGPAGLAVAASLKTEGVPFMLVDRRGTTGGAYNEIDPAVTLASPRRYTALPGLAPDPGGEYVTAGEIRRYLERYAKNFELTAEKRVVLGVEPSGDGFRVRFDEGEASVPFVVVATGMFDFPVRSRIPGLEGALHARDWKGPPAGKRVLVIGGATSGIEIAEACARASVPVVVSARSKIKILPQRFLGRDLHDYGSLFEGFPRWASRFLGVSCEDRPTLPGTDLGYKAFVHEGKIRDRGAVARFEGTRAFFASGEAEDFDLVVEATGYEFRMPFLDASVARARAGHPRTRRNESTSVPGLFFVGTPCAGGLASEFLRGIEKDGPLVAAEIRARLSGPRRLSVERGAGLLALSILLVHMKDLGFHRADFLWCCNAAALLVGLGLTLGWARANAIGFFWFMVGIPCWLIDIAHGGAADYRWTTLLTHFGAPALAAVGLRGLGIPRGTWWRAMLTLVGLQQLSRLLTSKAENVNLSYDVHGTGEGLPYPVYYAALTVIFSLTFLATEHLLRRATSRERRAAPKNAAGTTACS
jgi:putative flavoprotein involved in K+ transport